MRVWRSPSCADLVGCLLEVGHRHVAAVVDVGVGEGVGHVAGVGGGEVVVGDAEMPFSVTGRPRAAEQAPAADGPRSASWAASATGLLCTMSTWAAEYWSTLAMGWEGACCPLLTCSVGSFGLNSTWAVAV